MALTEEFVRALYELGSGGLPPEVAHETRRCTLNVLGTAIGAARTHEVDALVAVGSQVGGAEVVPPGRSEALGRLWASCTIGFSGHLDDFDDTHLATVIHPGAATLGALYPLCLLEGVPGDLALVAMALGVESQLRVGLAMTPYHYDAGWHITGTAGVIGAAVAAAYAWGLDAERAVAAVGLAANMTLGHREAFGTPIKALHAGKAASNGLLAASLARGGLDGPGAVLEGPGGYFAALSSQFDPARLEPTAVGRPWVLLENTYKPYPCGIVAHPAIEAAVALHGALGAGDLEAVEEVTVCCNPLVPELMGRPSADTGLEARFCAAHGVTVGLLLGRAGIAEFSDERATDPAVRRLRDRVRLVPSAEVGRQSATVRLGLRTGRSLEHTVVAAAGSLEQPMSDAALEDKFTALVEPVLTGRAKELCATVMSLGEASSFADVADAVARR